MFANIEIKNEIEKCISTKTFKNSFLKSKITFKNSFITFKNSFLIPFVLYLYDIQNFISVFLKFDKHITSYALKQVIKILECNRF